jgi:putative ABC transport system permease protein
MNAQKMRWLDVFSYSFGAMNGARVRTVLMLIAMAIGVAAVIVLTSLGEGARQFIAGEFSSLGTNLLTVMPGRSETSGANPGMFLGETTRDLTLDDALELKRDSRVIRIAPIAVGADSVSYGDRDREVPIFGTTREMLQMRRWTVAQGQFLSDADPHIASSEIVLGKKVRDELFASKSALGEWVRIGDRRFRVVGILASEGHSLGQTIDDMVIIPVASAQQLFNSPSLFRVMVEVKRRDVVLTAKQNIIDTIRKRHQGEDDITVITQDAILATFDKIIRTLTYGVAGIAAISLGVAGILIMNVMLIAVTQRTTEIGLLKALGAHGKQIRRLFLTEAILLSCLGCLLGIITSAILISVITLYNPEFSLSPPWWAVSAAIVVALFTGAVFGVAPANKAARLDPIAALARR